MASMDGDSMAMSVSAAPPRDRALLVQPAAHSGGPAPAVVATFEELIGLEGVAEGLYGEVYIATWRGQDVAVKVQKTNVKQLRMEKVAAVGGKVAMNTVNEDVAYSFDLEKAVLSNIRPHPNIVRLLAYGAHDNRSFLVEEQLESTLTKRITSTPLPFDEALRHALALAEGMHHLHSRALDGYMILHRDMKPDNIMFTREGQLKLVDFGLSRVIEKAAATTAAAADPHAAPSSVLFDLTGRTGSLRYMAPEVADCKPYNSSSEVYTWAIIVWEMTTKERPYADLDRKLFMDSVVGQHSRPNLNHPACDTWPDSLRRLVTRCWSPNYLDRPAFDEVVGIVQQLALKTTHK